MLLCFASFFLAVTAYGQLGIANTTGITINDNSTATPYPSTISVSNLVGVIEKVVVNLNSVSHNYPDDIDILLVSPAGTQVIIMSDAGGQFDINKVFLSFDFFGNRFPLPDETQISNGTYLTSNYPPDDTFPGVTLSPSIASNTLSNLVNETANGDWKLYVVDDQIIDAGTIGSWSLTFYMAPTIAFTDGTTVTNATTTEDVSFDVNFRVNDSDTPLGDLTYFTAFDTNFISSVTIDPGSTTNRVAHITPKANANTAGGPATVITIGIRDGSRTVFASINLTISAVNDPPQIINLTSATTIPIDGLSTNIPFTLSDVDAGTDFDGFVLTATSDHPEIVSGTNVYLTGSGTSRGLRVGASGQAAGTAKITLKVVDTNTVPNGPLTNTASFNVVVTNIARYVQANNAKISVPDGAAVNSTNTVPSSVKGRVADVEVVLLDVEHPISEQLGVTLNSRGNQSVLLASSFVGPTPVTDIWLKLDDESGNTIGAPLTSGTYRPASPLTSLDNIPAAGEWVLNVSDNLADSTVGSINGGWILSLILAPTIEVANTVNTTLEDKPLTIPVKVGDYDGDPSKITLAATSGAPGLFTAAVSGSGTNRSVAVTPVLNQNGTNTLTLVATDEQGVKETNVLTIAVQAVNDPPTLAPIPKIVTFAGDPISTNIIVGDVDDPVTSLKVSASVTSDDSKILPVGSIFFSGTGNDRTMTIIPGAQSGTALVTVTVMDPGTSNNVTSRTFEFTARPVGTRLFGNTGIITINDSTISGTSSNASPYPSTIAIPSGTFSGVISDLQVTLFNVTHPSPQDLDILLAGPTGTNIILMSDVGGNNPITNQTLVFRATGMVIPSAASTQLAAGIYQPTDGAPNGTTGEDTSAEFSGVAGFRTTSLDTFDGSSPNGTWSLYVRDDSPGPRGGVIERGWLLNIRTRPMLAAIPTVHTLEDTATNLTKLAFADDPQQEEYTVIVTNNAAAFATVTATNQSGFVNVSITPLADQFGTNTVSITVSNLVTMDTSTRTFTLEVESVDDAPRFASLDALYTTIAATPRSVTFSVSDAESAASAITVTANSLNTALVPNSNIKVTAGAGGSRTITLVPSGTLTGDAKIDVTATDTTNQKTVKQFTLRVLENRQAFASGQTISIPTQGDATPFPSTLNVPSGGVKGELVGIQVILDGLTHAFPDDLDILLVHPDGTHNVRLMSDVGGSNAVTNVRLAFQDGAPALPDSGPIVSGTYSPTDVDVPTEPFEQIGPFSSFGSNIAQFMPLSPTGNWSLYVRDDTFPDGGSLSNWIILFQTAPLVSGLSTTNNLDEDTPKDITFSIVDGDTDSTNLVLSAMVDTGASGITPNLLVNSNITFTAMNEVGKLSIKPSKDLFGESAIKLTVGDDHKTNTFNLRIIVKAINDAPTITVTNANLTTKEDTAITIPFNVGDVDNTLDSANLTISIASDNPGLIFSTNITATMVASGTTGNINVTFTPAANRPLTAASEVANIRVTINDKSTTDPKNLTASVDVKLTVEQVNDAPSFVSPAIPGTVNVEVGSTSQLIPFGVSDLETPTRDLSVTVLSSSNPALVPAGNVEVGFGSSGDTRTLQITPVGDTPGMSTIALVIADLGANGDATIKKTTNMFVVNVTPLQGTLVANTAKITIPDSGKATNYPSTITIAGTVGPVNQVYVTLEGVTHTNPDDLDIMLVSPSGKAVMLMSDAGGSNPLNNLRIQISDVLWSPNARSLPDEGTILGGGNVYQASNYRGSGETTEILPAPAPIIAGETALADFRGESTANGDWKLYVADDTAGNSGAINNGWTLRIVTSPSLTLASGTVTNVLEDNPIVVKLDVADGTATDLPNDLTVSYQSGNSTLLPVGDNITKSWSGNTLTVTAQPATNQWGTNTFTVIVARGNAANSIKVPVGFASVDDAPTLSRLSTQDTVQDTPIWVPIMVSDPDTPFSNLQLQATSGSTAVVSTTNLLFTATSGSNSGSNPLTGLTQGTIYYLRIQPNTSAIGSSLISVTVRQTNDMTKATTDSFTVNVADQNDPPIISVTPTSTNVVSGLMGSATVTVVDPDVGDTITFRTPTSSDQGLIRDQDISLSGSGRTRTVTFLTRPGTNGTVSINLAASDGTAPDTSTKLTVVIEPTREKVYASSGEIIIQDKPVNDGRALPYPSTIRISDLVGPITKVAVTLDGFQHTFPSDVDILLVGPGGQKVVLISDAGGNASVSNLVLRFEQGAGSPSVPLVTGTFTPTNLEGENDTFPDAPAGAITPESTGLNVFNGTDPNGDWRLYVVDDTPSDSGRISRGWSLAITTRPTISSLPDITIGEDTVGTNTIVVADEAFLSNEITFVSFSSTNTALLPTANIKAVPGSGRTRQITVAPATNQFGQSEVTVTIRSGGIEVSDKFLVIVTNINDVPEIVGTLPRTTNIVAGRFLTIPLIIRDVETDRKDLNIQITSSNPSVIPVSYIRLVDTNLIIFTDASAVGEQPVRSDIELIVTDADGAQANAAISVVVEPARNTFVRGETISIPEVGSATPFPSTITVTNLQGKVNRVTVTLRDITHRFPDDLDIMLVHKTASATNRIILMSDAGSGNSAEAALDKAWLRFDDAAPDSLPDSTAITNKYAAYKPTNYEGVSTDFQGGVVATNNLFATLAAAFNGLDPNGEWSLYVSDDQNPDGGSIGGWQITIETTAPIIDFISNIQIPEEGTNVVTFVVSDDNLTGGSFSYNTNDVRFVNVSVTPGTAGTNTLTIVGKKDQFGTDTVVLTVKDADGNTATRSFTVTVTPVNDAPAITGLANASTPANVPLNLPFSVNDVESGTVGLTVTATSGNTNVATVGLSGSNGAFTLTVTPQTLDITNVVVTVSASDGIDITVQQITVMITEKLGPKVSAFLDINTDEEVSPPVIPFTVTSPSGNPLVTVSASNTNLFFNLGVTGTGTNRNLVIILAPNAFGTSTITVTAQDEFGTASSSFTLTVRNVPDAPTIGKIPDQIVAEDDVLEIPLQVADVDTPLDMLTFSFATSNTNLVRNVEFPAGTNRIARVILGKDQNGVAAISIIVRDPENGTASSTFALTVTPVNDAPVLLPLANVTAQEDDVIRVPLTVVDPDTAINALTFSGSSSNTNLVKSITFDTTGSAATAIISLVTNKFGTATVTLSVSEGTNVSSQSFTLTVQEVHEPPVLGAIANVTVEKSTSERTVEIPLDVADPDNSLSELTLFAGFEGNVVSDVRFNLTSSNSVVALVTIKANVFGTDRVAISVSDGFDVARQFFNVTVQNVNLPPVAQPVSDITVTAGPVEFDWSVTDPDTAIADLTFFGGAATTNIVKSIQFAPTGPSTVHVTIGLVANATGSDRVVLTASDGENTSRVTFNLTVQTQQAQAATLSIAKSGSDVVISVTGTANATYTIESIANFGGTWNTAGTVTLDATGKGSLTLAASENHLFIRAKNP